MDGFEDRARAMGYRAVAGVDEAGRGPLAGPVVAAAVILPSGFTHPSIRDSKALSPSARDKALSVIRTSALSVASGSASPGEIDRVNILQASLLAMARAVERLDPPADFLYVDGTFPVPWPGKQETLVGGDARCLSVMAASIVAKVTRDALMEEYDRAYPGYGFAGHKGYPTREHLEALRRLGPCPIHRTTFRGVAPAGRPPEARPAAGREAEELACRYLEGKGLSVAARNYRARGGEIDIVAREGGAVVFVEVRFRESADHGAPEESIGRPKMLKIVRAARDFLAGLPPGGWEIARFDVVAIEGGPGAPVIRHYPGAFDARGKIL